ncbi:MAG: fibronectin type III domain-containing protein, partial [Gammaproteobacteria bacterium]|nr:fibronectin type III domain-containing protein [Gammaproteobacteria bacterium]
APLGFERAEGMEEAVHADFGDFPNLPAQHVGYALLREESLPLQVLPSISDSDTTLEGLSVSGATLTPHFSPEETDYIAIVGHTMSSVSVNAIPSNADASVSLLDATDTALPDSDASADGHQVNLNQGENTFHIRVTSVDSLSTNTYTVVVTRDKPINVCGRTPQVRDAIVEAVPDAATCIDATEAQLSEITRLNLNRKNIDSLKLGDFAGLTNLLALELTDNGLSTIPPHLFSDISNLGYLSLAGNPLSEISADTFAGLSTIDSLDLSEIGLTTLPSSVFSSSPTLGKVRLYGNRLTGLPLEVFHGLPRLYSIDLGRNQLSILPEGIFSGLSTLKDLDLYGNRLEILSAGEFANLPALEVLHLRGNSLAYLPTGVFSKLEALTWLDLSENLFASLPAGVFSGLTHLETLDTTHNLIEPLALPVSLKKAGENQYKVTVPSGAPFNLELSISITDAEGIDPAITTVTIPAGAVESGPLSVGQNSAMDESITVDIAALPNPPDRHQGYVLAKDESLPLLFGSGQKAPALDQVTGVGIVPGIESLVLSWTAVSDADGYNVQWRLGDEEYTEERQAVIVGGDTTTHTITELTASLEYTVRVIATRENADDGPPSSEVTRAPQPTPPEQVPAAPQPEPPAQVTGVEVIVGVEELNVSWTAVSDADGYKVQWKSGGEDYDADRQVVLLGGDTTGHTIIDLTTDTAYTVRVIATKENADDGASSEEVTATLVSANPDVNGDGMLDGNDALIMYQAFASEAQVGDGETGGTAASRQALLAGYSGKVNPADGELKEMIRKALVWQEAGVAAGGDMNEDGEINESDAFVMYYAYTNASLLGDGNTGGTARFRQLLLSSFANKANPTDEDLKAMLQRAHKLREEFG